MKMTILSTRCRSQRSALLPHTRQQTVPHPAVVTGVRYTRRIDAGYDLTAEQMTDGVRFDDVIAVQSTFGRHPLGGVIHPPRHADLSYRIMLPQGAENLIVASGKSASIPDVDIALV